MASLKPFVFFDLGDTIVDLADTIEVLARLISERYPIMAPDSHDLAKRWFVGLAQTVPRVESEPFEMQRDIGSRVLARSLATCGVTTDTPSARRLLRRAWDEWQENAKLCPGVTKEWLQQICGLCAGVGAVTDGDDRDVKRLLEKTGLRPYFDSVTTS